MNNLKHSFGAIAAQYDAARPGYPAAVVAAILAPFADDAPLSILEIGCGSGQATQLFAERGITSLPLTSARTWWPWHNSGWPCSPTFALQSARSRSLRCRSGRCWWRRSEDDKMTR